MIYALKTAAQTQDERLVALIRECSEVSTEIAQYDIESAAHVLNAILDLQRARSARATGKEDAERLARIKN